MSKLTEREFENILLEAFLRGKNYGAGDLIAKLKFNSFVKIKVKEYFSGKKDIREGKEL